MNNLAYTAQDAAVVGEKVEEKVGEEPGAGAPLTYQVEAGEASGATAGTLLRDIGAALVGGSDQTLFRLHFDLTNPRPAHLQVNVNRQGVGTHVGLLLYSAKFNKPVSGEIALEDPKFFGKAKFTGDAAVTGKLNANGDLIKRSNEFARVESQS